MSPYKDPKKAQATQNERRRRQSQIEALWEKGYSKAARIAEKTGYPLMEVERHLRLIKRSYTPKTEKALQYRKNRVLAKIHLVQRMAWEIAEGRKGQQISGDTLALSALRVVTASQELEAKVQGVTQEKLVVGPGQEASRLLSDILNLEKKAKVAQESSDEESGKTITTPLPEFLKEIDDAGPGDHKSDIKEN